MLTFRKPELIDTLWNVNTLLIINALFSMPELIDTLWNVNANSTFLRYSGLMN